jgi:alkanesulfonate monooxygenase
VRYGRAEEFVDVVRELWDSWEDDAFVWDKKSGRYFDPAKMHYTNHKGENFSVRGPLNIARAPQGYPVIAQAGASEPGQELAARTADLVYTARKDLDGALQFYKSVKGRLPKYGRSPDSMVVMPGVLALIGKTPQEARDKQEQLNELLHPIVGYSELYNLFGDLSDYPIDGPPPPLPADTNSVKSGRAAWEARLKRQKMTIKEIYQDIAMSAQHKLIVGTPTSIADELEEWFTAGACDGFNIMVPHMPAPLYQFLEEVVPELRRRGLFRTEYEGRTLRENMGLPRPANRFAAAEPALQRSAQ